MRGILQRQAELLISSVAGRPIVFILTPHTTVPDLPMSAPTTMAAVLLSQAASHVSPLRLLGDDIQQFLAIAALEVQTLLDFRSVAETDQCT